MPEYESIEEAVAAGMAREREQSVQRVLDVMRRASSSHQLTTKTEPRRGNGYTNVAECACGERFDWYTRRRLHAMHVEEMQARAAVDTLEQDR